MSLPFASGPINIASGFSLSLQPISSTGADAFTHVVPVHAKHIRLRTIAMLLGGPFANLLSAVAIILMAHNISIFSSWLVVFSVIGACNLIPFRRLSTLSDGKRILMLLRSDGHGERWLAIMQLAADIRNGIAPEEFSPDLITKATAIRDNSPDTFMAHLFAYSASWNTGLDADIASFLEICLQHSNYAQPLLREIVFCDAGVFLGRKRKRADLANGDHRNLGISRLGIAATCGGGDLRSGARCRELFNKLEEVKRVLLVCPTLPRTAALKALQHWQTDLLRNS